MMFLGREPARGGALHGLRRSGPGMKKDSCHQEPHERGVAAGSARGLIGGRGRSTLNKKSSEDGSRQGDKHKRHGKTSSQDKAQSAYFSLVRRKGIDNRSNVAKGTRRKTLKWPERRQIRNAMCNAGRPQKGVEGNWGLVGDDLTRT